MLFSEIIFESKKLTPIVNIYGKKQPCVQKRTLSRNWSFGLFLVEGSVYFVWDGDLSYRKGGSEAGAFTIQ